MIQQADIRAQREAWFIECARTLLDEHGYEGMSMNALAESARFTKRTLYQYFKNKREVYLAVVGSDLVAIEQALEDGDDEGATGRERYLLCLGAFLGFVRRHPSAYERVFSFEENDFHIRRELDEHDVHLSRCIEIHHRITQRTLGFIELGQRDGSIASERPASEIMLGGWSAMVGVIQVMAMREANLRDGYGTSAESMYGMLMGMIERVLDGQV